MLELSSLQKIAIVTSNFKIFAFFKQSLKDIYQTIHFKKLEDLLEWLERNEAEVIILEDEKTGKPLQEICRFIRDSHSNPSAPILLITNKIQKKFIIDALSAGIADFIHEPLIESEIFQRISVSLKSKFINKKVSFISSKIKSSRTSSRGFKSFSNRLLLNDKSLKAISNAKKMEIPLSILIIQIDAFQELKQYFTARSLKEILSKVEEIIKKKLKQRDTLLCQGEGNYLIMLPNLTLTSSKIIAESIRKDIFDCSFPSERGEIHTSVSIGVLCFDQSFNDDAQAYELFDRSISRIKKSLEDSQKNGNKIIFDTPVKKRLS